MMSNHDFEGEDAAKVWEEMARQVLEGLSDQEAKPKAPSKTQIVIAGIIALGLRMAVIGTGLFALSYGLSRTFPTVEILASPIGFGTAMMLAVGWTLLLGFGRKI